MNQIFNEDHPLFPEVLKGVREIVSAVQFGLKYESSSVDVQEPGGEWLNIPRMDWLNELRPALLFFEQVEYYEDCAQVQDCIRQLELEPTIESLIKSITNDDSSSHDA